MLMLTTTRRECLSWLARGLLAASLANLLGMSQCTNETGALKSLRNVLNTVESALKTLMGLGLVSDIITQAAKYLTTVTNFVNQAAEVLEDAALTTAQQAAKILALGAQVALPHFDDPRVQAALLTVQSAVSLFLTLFQSQNPPAAQHDQKTVAACKNIEKDANLDTARIVAWAKGPNPAPTAPMPK